MERPIGEPYESEGRWFIKDAPDKKARRIPDPVWSVNDLAKVLGMHSVYLGRFLNGVGYPEVQTMKRFEYLFGWPCSEQIDLIPFHGHGRQPMDLRYSMVLKQVIEDWKHNNPKTVASTHLVSLVPHGHPDPFGRKAREAAADEGLASA